MNSIIIKIKLLMLSFVLTASAFGQQKLTKLEQSIKVNKDVVIDLNTSHCNVVFDTWNKNTIEIEAYVEGEKISGEALKSVLKSWDVDIDATYDKVSINTNKTNSNVVWVEKNEDNDGDLLTIIFDELKYELADLPQAIMNGLAVGVPEMPAMPEMPQLPELPTDAHAMEFDYEAYKRDGEKYLKKYEEKFEATYGKDFEAKMEAWGERFGEEWGEKFGKHMEVWAEDFEKRFDSEEFEEKMEAWGERFGAQMEAQAERIEAQANRVEAQGKRVEANRERQQERAILLKNRQKEVEKLMKGHGDSNVKKTIKIKMPNHAKLKVNIKYGEVEFASNINDLKANLSHSKFTAYSINGSSTSINASYSPVNVSIWNLGELNLNYVKDAKIKEVKQLVLNATSSNIDIDKLTGSAIIDGNIGDLNISKIEDSFNNLNIILQNSNAFIKLPNVDTNVQYKGSYSKFLHPNQSPKNQSSSSFSKSGSSGKSIIINAKYSNVEME
ncbi:YggN family protein [Algibacter sp. L4_22]|uniref:YggN family protein n=1 Tax=Algibacter sp. L4_22 TaxID=2942477 RepID=UPI00201B62AE|nr:YggN family protein [Algibacter sp. L4_22]MCL5128081.1 YggN family protein [Algibacter sp. L4_22]